MVRLRYAYADTLEAAGRETDALAWFHRTHAIDSEEITDAAERAEALGAPQSGLSRRARSGRSARSAGVRPSTSRHNGATTTYVSLDVTSLRSTRPLGKAYLDAGSEGGTVTTRTALHARSRDEGRALRPLRAVRAVPAHRVGRRRRARRCREPDWTPQPAQAGTYRAELSWSGDAGLGGRHGLGAARLEPPALRGHRGADARAPRAPATPTRPSSASSTPSPACTATS